MSERLHVLNPNYINVGIESISDAVEAVEINPQLHEFVSQQDYPHLFDENWIIQQCAVHTTPPHIWTQPRKSEIQRRNVVTPGAIGRALTISHQPIVYGNDIQFVARQIYAKGIGQTGSYYSTILLNSRESIDLAGITYHQDPIGYFGLREAQKEIGIGNYFLKHNCRVHLPIAILELNTQKLLDLTAQQWCKHPRVIDEVIEPNVRKVEWNQDNLAIVVRAGNTSNRLSALSGDRHVVSGIQMGAQTFLDEINLAVTPKSHPYLQEVDRSNFLISGLKKLRKATTMIKEEEMLTDQERDQLTLFLKGLINTQAHNLRKAINDPKNRYYLYQYCGVARDTDFGLSETDWEEASFMESNVLSFDLEYFLDSLRTNVLKKYYDHLLARKLIKAHF